MIASIRGIYSSWLISQISHVAGKGERDQDQNEGQTRGQIVHYRLGLDERNAYTGLTGMYSSLNDRHIPAASPKRRSGIVAYKLRWNTDWTYDGPVLRV